MDPRDRLRGRVTSLRTGVRRRVLRHRRLLSALAAAVAVLAALRVLQPAPPETVTLLAAARDLPAGTVLVADDLVATRVAAEAVPDGVATDPVGETVAAPVRRGEVLTDLRLVGPDLVAAYPGTVALPVRIPDSGSVELLAVGDRVDLFAAPAGGVGDGVAVAREVPVLALPVDRPGGSTGGAATTGRLVLLAVDQETAASVSGHAARSLLSLAISR